MVDSVKNPSASSASGRSDFTHGVSVTKGQKNREKCNLIFKAEDLCSIDLCFFPDSFSKQRDRVQNIEMILEIHFLH